MGTSVYLKMKDGRLITVLEDADDLAARNFKDKLDRWVQTGESISLMHQSGSVDEITPRGVLAVEMQQGPRRTDLDIV
jgi:hypothetical protein